jgi:hypothetical protein
MKADRLNSGDWAASMLLPINAWIESPWLGRECGEELQGRRTVPMLQFRALGFSLLVNMAVFLRRR